MNSLIIHHFNEKNEFSGKLESIFSKITLCHP
jgi:hypothetical protein